MYYVKIFKFVNGVRITPISATIDNCFVLFGTHQYGELKDLYKSYTYHTAFCTRSFFSTVSISLLVASFGYTVLTQFALKFHRNDMPD